MVKYPFDDTTRYQGISFGLLSALNAHPTALADLGLPHIDAIWEYVDSLPFGIRFTVIYTFSKNDVIVTVLSK